MELPLWGLLHYVCIMDNNFIAKINNSQKVYHLITINEQQILFDYDKMLIVRSNEILNLFLRQKHINDKFIKKMENRFGSDVVSNTLSQIEQMINGSVIYKKDYTNEFQNKSVEFIHAEISFPTIHSCNLRCRYCFASSGYNYSQNEENEIIFSEKLMKKSLDFFVSKFAPNAKYYRVDFVGGGEPLLNFDIIEATYLYAKELETKIGKPIKIWVCTNGTVFDKSILDKISSMNLSIGVSIDGNEEAHDISRKYIDGKGTYKDIMKGIQQICNENNYSKKLKDIWVLSVIHGLNLNVLQILQHHINHGFTTVQMKPVRLDKSHELSLNSSNYKELINQYCILKDYLVEKIKEGDVGLLKVILNDNDYWGRIIISIIMKQKIIYRCGAGKYKLSVSANGDIYPCDSFVGNPEYILGNIFAETIEVNKTNKFYEAHVFNRNPCHDCWNKFLCGGDCYYNSVLTTNSLFSVDPVICELKRKLSELAIEIVFEISQKENMLNRLSKFVSRRRNYKMQGEDRNVTNINRFTK